MSKRHGGRPLPAVPQHRLTASANEIMTRAPLLQASRQMESGWESERGGKAARWYWDGCPKLKPIPAGGTDLRGVRQGRLTCVGLLAKRAAANGSSWVVRCTCGMFETRSSKALRNPANTSDACSQCGYVWHLRRQAFFDLRGRWPAPDEVAP